MAKLGEARYDENRNLAFGVPGDQTGMEVSIIDFYCDASRPWEKVFRAKRSDVRAKLAEAMTQACNNANIGYAQYGDGATVYKDRYGLYYALQKNKPIGKVAIPCNCDCSSLVAQCMIQSGVPISMYMRTAVQVDLLRNTGEFDEINYAYGTKLVTGDIMWRNGHTAIITTGDTGYPTWVGQINAFCNVYSSASTKSALLPQYPYLGKDNLVDVCGDSGDFYYVRIAAKYFGWVQKKYLGKVQYTAWVGEINTYCNVYTSPSTGSALLSTYPHLGKGNLIDVTDENGDFYYVRIAAKYFGFVQKKYVQQPKTQVDPEPAPQPIVEKFEGKVTTLLNVRTQPNSSASFCTFDRNDGKGQRHTLNQNEIIPIIGKEGNWYKLEIVGANKVWYAYASASYIIKTTKKEVRIGSKVNFLGNQYYTSSYAGGKAVTVKPFQGIITMIVKGNPHPYLIKSLDSSRDGWVNENDIEII